MVTMTVMNSIMMKDYFTCMWLDGVGVNLIQLSVTLLSCHTRSVGHPDHQGVLILLPFIIFTIKASLSSSILVLPIIKPLSSSSIFDFLTLLLDLSSSFAFTIGVNPDCKVRFDFIVPMIIMMMMMMMMIVMAV